MYNELKISQPDAQPEAEAAEYKQTDRENLPPEAEDTAAIPSQPLQEKDSTDEASYSAPEISGERDDGKESPPDEADTTVCVKFNKQERTYTVEQAVPLVEMGLKWESFRPQHEKLRYMALSQGKSVSELIELVQEDFDERLYARLLEECGGNQAAAKRLHETQKAEMQRRYEQACAQEQIRQEQQDLQTGLEERLADDFLLLVKEVPDRFAGFEDVPSAVVDSAVKENLCLLDAYLRYELQEKKKAAAAQATQAQAAARSAGSLEGKRNSPETDLNSFEHAFYTALG
ncbi:MAG: hypothetical protein PHH84_07610 [Oscillospiraceae bacterium]|nr:hypothetical protein [Oscillospiraceae bacterium]MDD4414068.1 hypothetical protein [Oscillospiraceae bacterium]